MIDQQTAMQLGRIITLRLQGRTMTDIAQKMRLPRSRVDFLLWKYCRQKSWPDVPPRRVLQLEQRWSALYDTGAMGVRAVKETA